MGQILSEPVTEKHTDTGGDDRLHWGSSEMQGWRISMLKILLFWRVGIPEITEIFTKCHPSTYYSTYEPNYFSIEKWDYHSKKYYIFCDNIIITKITIVQLHNSNLT